MSNKFSVLGVQKRREKGARPVVMGIINATPDSFSDGGQFYVKSSLELNKLVDVASKMVEDGAEILDVGGESTRPGAKPVSVSEEEDRVLPVIEAIASLDAVISLDSSQPSIMRSAKMLGVGLINDVRALEIEGAVDTIAELSLPVCLMHMKGVPVTMQQSPNYEDVLGEVDRYLTERIDVCLSAGIAPENVLIDPGFGFGKTLEHNMLLLKGLPLLVSGSFPVLAGLSRKSLIDHVHQALGESRDVSQRLPGSLALALVAAENGAAIIRVHDVRETVDALKVVEAYHRVTGKLDRQ